MNKNGLDRGRRKKISGGEGHTVVFGPTNRSPNFLDQNVRKPSQNLLRNPFVNKYLLMKKGLNIL
jgi:hypothetical protein